MAKESKVDQMRALREGRFTEAQERAKAADTPETVAQKVKAARKVMEGLRAELTAADPVHVVKAALGAKFREAFEGADLNIGSAEAIKAHVDGMGKGEPKKRGRPKKIKDRTGYMRDYMRKRREEGK